MPDDARPLQDLSDAFDSIGHPMYSNLFLARVLAFGHMTGWPEYFVLHKSLSAVTMIAAKRFKIEGGEIPRADLLQIFAAACHEIALTKFETPWLVELADRYKVPLKNLQINYDTTLPPLAEPTKPTD